MEKKAVLGDIHPSGQLLFALGVSMLLAIITLLAGILLAVPFTEQGLMEMLGNMNQTSHINLMKYIQVVSHLGMFIFSSLVLAWFFGRDISRYLYLQSMPRAGILLLSVVVIFTGVPFINYILEWNMQMHLPDGLKWLEDWMRTAEQNAEQLTETFLKVHTLNGLVLNLFVIAVIPAIGEELMFRGVLMRIFRKWFSNPHVAVWITAIIFSAIHIQFFGFFPRMILGVLFGYLVVYTGSLWPAIIAHFVNNASAVISYYLYENKITGSTYENIGTGPEGLAVAVISLVLTVGVIVGIKRIQPRVREDEGTRAR